jgi:hypothetical protein
MKRNRIQTTDPFSGSDSEGETRRRKTTKQPSGRSHPVRGTSEDDSEPDSENSKDSKNGRFLQRIIYFLIMLYVVLHIVTSLILLTKLPKASFLVVFNGIVSPTTFILFVVGFMSCVYGWLALFRDPIRRTTEMDARWFRRYIRMNRYLLLVSILSTQATVFGCWKFIFAQDLDKRFPQSKLAKDKRYQLLVRRVIQALPKILVELEEIEGITPDTPPLGLMRFVGINYILCLFLLSVLPGILLYVAIWAQRKYYRSRFPI